MLDINVSEKHVMVCASEQLAEMKYLIVRLLYKGAPHSGIVFRYRGQALAYLNQCVHMPRALDCERDTIFDERQELLRCNARHRI